MALNSTYAIRLGSIVAGIAWIVLLFAPGSRADESDSPVVSAGRADEGSAISTTAPPTTVAPVTSAAPSTLAVPPAPSAPSASPTTGKPAAPVATAPRVFSLREIVGVGIDRGSTWIAIATSTVVDQTGAPAAGVEVEATWSFESTPASCRTDVAGKCSMYRSGVPANLDSVTITLTAPQVGAKTIGREGVN